LFSGKSVFFAVNDAVYFSHREVSMQKSYAVRHGKPWALVITSPAAESPSLSITA
jgi:hypothetical protein